MSTYKDLLAYKKAFKLAMDIFEITKRFPKNEAYELTNQIRRSSRSVCANFAEAFQRRQYPLHFKSKMTDADTENAETEVWLELAYKCKYLTENEYQVLSELRKEVGRLIGDILKNPDKYL